MATVGNKSTPNQLDKTLDTTILNNSVDNQIEQDPTSSQKQLNNKPVEDKTLSNGEKVSASNQSTKDTPNSKIEKENISTNTINKKKSVLFIPPNYKGGEHAEIINQMAEKSVQIAKRDKEEGLRTQVLAQQIYLIDETKITRKKLKIIDSIVAVLALFSMIIAYWENEEFISQKTVVKESYNKDTQENYKTKSTEWVFESNNMCHVLRFINVIITLNILVLLIKRYQLYLKLLILKRRLPDFSTLWSSKLIIWLVIELMICVVCTPPYLDSTIEGTQLGAHYVYAWDSLIEAWMLLRLYLILRLYPHYSRWTSSKAEETSKRYKIEIGIMFAIKADLKQRSYLMIAIFLVTSILFLGVALRIFEMTYVQKSLDFKYLTNAMWVIIITMTTVGYGDGYPSTHLGRLVAALGCIVGMLLVSLFVVSLTLASELTKEEQKAYYVLKHLRANDNAENKASNVIKAALRLKMAKERRKRVGNVIKQFIWFTKLRAAISEFKNQTKIAKSHDVPVDETLRQIQEKLEDDLQEIRDYMNDLPAVSSRCLQLKERQTQISDRFDSILKSQNKVTDLLQDLHAFRGGSTKEVNKSESESESQSSQTSSHSSSEITEEDDEDMSQDDE